jgi:hypothetical protein
LGDLTLSWSSLSLIRKSLKGIRDGGLCGSQSQYHRYQQSVEALTLTQDSTYTSGRKATTTTTATTRYPTRFFQGTENTATHAPAQDLQIDEPQVCGSGLTVSFFFYEPLTEKVSLIDRNGSDSSGAPSLSGTRLADKPVFALEACAPSFG